MKVKRFLDNINQLYPPLYHPTYWDGTSLYSEYLRWDDQWAAVCYAHGIYDNMLPNIKNLNDQIAYIRAHAQRYPKKVLEVGSGRGEVSIVLDHLGANVQSIDVNARAEEYHCTMSNFMFKKEPELTLFIGDLDSTYESLDLENIDTIIFVESIEHIFEPEWLRFYSKIKPILQKNHAHFIATNMKWYWPLGHARDCNEHVHLIDEEFYNNLASDAQQTLYRQTSHIALAY